MTSVRDCHKRGWGENKNENKYIFLTITLASVH